MCWVCCVVGYKYIFFYHFLVCIHKYSECTTLYVLVNIAESTVSTSRQVAIFLVKELYHYLLMELIHESDLIIEGDFLPCSSHL